MVTWSVLPRNPDLTRTADPISGWSSLTVVERHNLNDTGLIEGPAAALAPLANPAGGAIIMRDDELVTSGLVSSIEPSWSQSEHSGIPWLKIGIAGDLAALGGRVVYPDRTHAITSTAASVGAAYDSRTGSREDLILGYLSATLGPDALADRRLPGLALPASLHRGGTATVDARFDLDGTLIQDLAEAAGLRVRLVHDESTGTPRLLLVLTPVVDVSADIRFGPPGSAAVGVVSSYSANLSVPKATRVIALGGDQLAARVAVMATEADAEALWGRVIETTVDQRQTTDPATLLDAATKNLTDAAGEASYQFTVQDGPDCRARVDYRVGYRVGVDLPGLPPEVTDGLVREMTTTVTVSSSGPTEQVQVVVGSVGASATRSLPQRQAAALAARLAALERSA